MNMQVINSKPSGGFRELTSDEIMMVSGGFDDILVIGYDINSGSGHFGFGGGGFGGGNSHETAGYSPYATLIYGGEGSSGGGGPTHYPDGTDNDGDGIRETPPIVVTASATHGQIQAAHLSAQLSLYVSGVIASPVITIVGAQATAGLTLGQQVALNLAGAAVGAPLTNLLTQELYDSTFNQQLDQIQNPGSYPRTFLPY